MGDAKRAALYATVSESAIAGTKDVGDGRVQRCDQGGQAKSDRSGDATTGGGETGERARLLTVSVGVVEKLCRDERRTRARRWTAAHGVDGRDGTVRKVRWCWCATLRKQAHLHLPLSRCD